MFKQMETDALEQLHFSATLAPNYEPLLLFTAQYAARPSAAAGLFPTVQTMMPSRMLSGWQKV